MDIPPPGTLNSSEDPDVDIAPPGASNSFKDHTVDSDLNIPGLDNSVYGSTISGPTCVDGQMAAGSTATSNDQDDIPPEL